MQPGLLSESLADHAMIRGGAGMAGWPTLLVVDSDAEMLRTLACYFEKRGFHVAAAANLTDAKAFCHRRRTWTLVIADYHLNDGTGWELCCWMQEQPGWKNIPFILMSGSLNCTALCPGAHYLAKPFRMEALETRMRTLLEPTRPF
jgi:DNA-binding response OmpR family regulator